MYKSINAVVIALLLTGCSDGTPMKITDQHKQYLGVWQKRYEDIGENSINIDNVLLAINSDGTAVYRKCEVNETKTENSKSRSSSSTSFPSAVVTHIAENKIILVQEVGWFGFDEELNIDKAPYQENGNWFIDVEGKKLAKLDGREIRSETDWECPDDDDEEEE